MSHGLFVLLLGLVLIPFLRWAYKTLPREEWQIMASVPEKRPTAGSSLWQGSNITYYGFFLASGSILGVVVFFLLLASLSVPLMVINGLIAFVLLCSMAAAKGVAVFVEQKKNTFTVAGAAFVGLMLMPLAVAGYNTFLGSGPSLGLMPVMAALAVAYALGEGIGRLACISFGCCYGKPLAELGPLAGKVFSRCHVTFHGATKKIVYASGLAGIEVVPIQAVTSCLSVSVGLIGMYLFLEAYFALAFGVTAIFVLAWRVCSEQLRADFRGGGKFTAYQRMGIAAIFYCAGLLAFCPEEYGVRTNLMHGLAALWSPAVILFFQVLWVGLFLYTGSSKVIGATIALHVRKEGI